MRVLIQAALMLGLLLGWTAPAAAQPEDPAARDRARALVREGAALFRDGRRLAGVRKFEEAYAVFPAPEILYNLGKGYRDVGNNALAHRALSRFVRQAPDAARRPDAEQVLRDLELVVSRLTIEVRSEPGAPALSGVRVLLDGDEVGITPLLDAVAVEPGVHQVSAYRGDKLFAERQITATRGKLIPVVVEPAPGVPPPAVVADRIRTGDASERDPLEAPTPAPARPVYARWWFWTGVGAVVAGSVAITVLATRGNGDDGDLPNLGRFSFDEF
ncbi:MAG TPA: hypothetical protein VML75_04125 [Kofleriaceae bacterium]|nr:hypothetical protein [Kofleriaceae bacterium]